MLARGQLKGLSEIAGLGGIDRETLQGYCDLAQTGTVDDLVAYIGRHGLPMDRNEAEQTIASVQATASKRARLYGKLGLRP